MQCWYSRGHQQIHAHAAHLGTPAGRAVGAGSTFGPWVGQDAAESSTTVGPAPDALHHIAWDAVLVISHLSLRPPAPQTEVEYGGDLTASPSLRRQGSSEEWVERLEGEGKDMECVLGSITVIKYKISDSSFLTFPPSIMSTCSSFSSDRFASTSATPIRAWLRRRSSIVSKGGPKGERSGDIMESESRAFWAATWWRECVTCKLVIQWRCPSTVTV